MMTEEEFATRMILEQRDDGREGLSHKSDRQAYINEWNKACDAAQVKLILAARRIEEMKR